MSPPLDELYISCDNNEVQNLPALHPHWKEDMQFVLYQPPPLDQNDRAAHEEWLERSSFIEQDLHSLLNLQHDKFWCQVVFDDTLQRCVDSYLRNAPRHYDVVYQLSDDCQKLHGSLHKLFFLVCLRMATHKENKEHFITPHVFGEILYENFIFDIPKLMDLCVLYGDGNSTLLSKMITNIFSQQPKYKDDLQAVVPTVMQVFTSILSKCGVKSDSAPSSPQKLTAPPSTHMSLISMGVSEFQDLVFYLSDTAHTLQAFLEVYPPAAEAFHKEELTMKLATTYENLVSTLVDAMDQRHWEGENLKPLLEAKLRQAQASLIKVFRAIVLHTCLNPVMKLESVEEMEPHVEDYLQVMSAFLSERRFMAHLDMLFPFREDCRLLQKRNYPLDQTRIQFIEKGIKESSQVYCKQSRKKKSKASSAAGSTVQPEPDERNGDLAQEQSAVAEGGATDTETTRCPVSPVTLDSLISSVKDLLPDLGEGFIEVCLEEFNYEREAVIHAMLDGKLPESLQHFETSMPREKQTSVTEESFLEQRRNVFDNDEFDVFSRDRVDLSKIHKGKREKNTDAYSILDDKSNVDQLKPLYSRYGSEFTESMYTPVDEYEDEYDDTYDSIQVGADDENSADELASKRVLKPPPPCPSTDEKDSGSISEESDTEGSSSKDEFVPNPEKLREQQAARQAQRQADYERRHVRRQAQPRREHDVRGNPRGQGQSADVLRSRASKEKNKSGRVHHNRRVLADKKRRV